MRPLSSSRLITWRLRMLSAEDCDGVRTRAGPSSTSSAPMLMPPGVVKAIRAALEKDAVGGIVGIVARVGDLVDGVAEDRGLTRQTAERQLQRFHAET